ncbi:MAG TPA: CocE/NonD family hydrolase [Acidimicrobiales bacterium]|nr:CocE/NonD family hydrolase [Acidimicrobiales bacterium]
MLALLAGACSSDDGGDGDDAKPGSTRPKIDPSEETTAAAFEATPGVETLTVTGAEPGHDLTLVNTEDEKLLTLTTDEAGQAHFAYVPDEYLTFQTGEGGTLPSAAGQQLRPGAYTVRDESAEPVAVTDEVTVLARDDHPEESAYDQEVGEGFGYVTTRDGVELSVNVRLPGPIEDGPYPTVVEYSGYGPSNPDAEEPGSMIARLLGYATVGVNMRGTGCSGGVFDVFNPAQQADGYDMVETIARQPWVLHNKVGMVGLSYSGITQLYVAATRPPSLAAITPLSVIGDAWQMSWPGGINNNGFTEQWLAERNRQSEGGGTDWVTKRVEEEGDEACEANLAIRDQNPDFGEFTRALENRPPDADSRDLYQLVSDIEVPVYLTGAWQDEQTGPLFADMLDNFTGTEQERFNLFNGRHPDGYTPLVLYRWYEFLELYVHQQVPRLDDGLRAGGAVLFEDIFGVPGLTFEEDRFPEFADDDLEGVLAAYEAEPKVRVLFENGAGGDVPGSPAARFEATFEEWPPPAVTPVTWYLGPDGTLVDEAPGQEGADTFTNDPEAGQLTFFNEEAEDPEEGEEVEGGYDLLAPTWDFDWEQPGEGTSLSYVTEPFEDDTVLAGTGYADLWVQADSTDADVQVTITAVQADGTEFLVQSGQLRLSHRALEGEIGDDLEVHHAWDAESRQPLEPGEWVQAQVGIPSFAQAFRAGTRLRVVVSSPGRDRGTWKFATIGEEGDERQVGLGGERASSLVLSMVEGIEVPAGDPECPSLRGQACRPYEALANGD